MPGINGLPGIRTGIMGRQRVDVNLSPPTLLTSSFTVDTILGQLNWTNNAGSTAQFEVYSATNGGTETLIGTTIAGATSYQDTTCKQNASVVYRIRVKKGSRFSGYVSATALVTPLCWKTNQSVLTSHVLNTLNLPAGKSVTIKYSDATSQVLTNSNSNITKNFAATGQYNVWLEGDINSISVFSIFSQSKVYGVVTNWILPPNTEVRLYANGVTGDVSNWTIPTSSTFRIDANALSGQLSNKVVPSSVASFLVNTTLLSGSLPQIQDNAASGLNYNASSCSFSDSNAVVFRKAMTIFNVGNQNVLFPTANIDKLLKALADWYQANAPTANCTVTMSGANMGIPTGGSSNADLVRLVGYYTAVSKSCTILVSTS